MPIKPNRIEPNTYQPYFIIPGTTFEVTLEDLHDAYAMQNGSILQLYNAGVYDGHVDIPYGDFYNAVKGMINGD